MSIRNALKRFLNNTCINTEIKRGFESIYQIPDLSKCIRNTLLVWLPCAIILCSSLVWISILQDRPTMTIKRSKLNKLKTVICLFLLTINLAIISGYFFTLIERDQDSFVKHFLLSVVTFLLTVIVWREYKSGIATSGVVSLAWLQLVFFGLFELRAIAVKGLSGSYEEYAFLLSHLLQWIQLILCFFVDNSLQRQLKKFYTKNWTQDKDPKQCPEETCCFFSRLTFFWISRLMLNGYKKALNYEDLYETRRVDNSQEVISRFERIWDHEVLKKKVKIIRKADKEVLVGFRQLHYFDKREELVKEVSLIKVLLYFSGGINLYSGLLKLLYDLFAFLQPILLNLLINHLKSEGEPIKRGLSIVFAMFVISVMRTFLVQHFWNTCLVVGQHLRTALVGLVYRKALRLNNGARRDAATGEIVNLMSVDANRFDDTPCYMHTLWVTPLTIGLSFYILWQFLGPSVLAGLLCMIVMIPVNAILAYKNKKLQVEQMDLKDDRIKQLTEILTGIKVLKLYSWEDWFIRNVQATRKKEVKRLRKSQFISAMSSVSWFLTPFLVALSTFTVYVLSSPENVLDANTAFVSMSLFSILNHPISILPLVINVLIQVVVSTKRLKLFLLERELRHYAKDYGCCDRAIIDENAIEFRSASFKWSSVDPYVLHDLSLAIGKGKLVALIGPVGSGKSSFLSAICGEMDECFGFMYLQGTVAYVPQQAWIRNATIRDNIVFYNEYIQLKYQAVVEACDLRQDLDNLPAFDQTEVGEKGINLSGGQKQRVSLARAVYQNKDVYLLDDPLSALDSNVGEHIFKEVIANTGVLKGKTRILVTNDPVYLSRVDAILVLKEGRVVEMGTFNEIMSSRSSYTDFLMSGQPFHAKTKDTQRRVAITGSLMRRRRMQMSISSNPSRLEVARLMTEELSPVGKVRLSVFMRYVKACQICPSVFFLLFYVWFLSMQIASSLWLSSWSEDRNNNDTALRDYRIKYYILTGLGQSVSLMGSMLVLAYLCTKSSENLHSLLLRSVIRAPMSFYDTTPIGRIINRFSRDIDILDVTMPVTLRIWMGTFSAVFTTSVVVCYTTIYFVFAMPVLMTVYFFIQNFYIRTFRQLRRINSNLCSPIYTHFEESLTGCSSIRAYKEQDRFIGYSDELLDMYTKSHYVLIATNRWMGLWLDILGTFILLMTGLFCVYRKDSINPGLAGLALVHALQVTLALNIFMRMVSELETNIVSVERIDEYINCPQEAPAHTSVRPPLDWPSSGRIEFQDYSTRYRDGLQLVLKNITCSFNSREKVGIVGRTGSGKSSLTMAIFRIIEPASGSITIDDIDTSTIGLYDLRSKLTIIPQDPVLFSGSLKMNIDPSGLISDHDIWNALEQARLKKFVSNLPELLETVCSEGGQNISVGQRQLICMARALLRKTNILIMDEATASIDPESDGYIQETIRTEFGDCTIITIAHRLKTIIDYDRILVMERGNVVEFDNPKKLISDRTSAFYKMANSRSSLLP